MTPSQNGYRPPASSNTPAADTEDTMHCLPGPEVPAHVIDQLATTTRRAELHALRTNPTSRALFWLGMLLTIEILLLTALVTGTWTWPLLLTPLVAPASLAITVASATTFRAHPIYTKAWRIAWCDTPTGRAVARITHTPDTDTWRVDGVAAWPMGTGLGTQVMHRIAQEADTAGIPLTLQASSRRVVRFYERLGWYLESNHRSRRGGYPMTRTPNNRPAEAYTGHTEHTQSVSAGQPPEPPQTPHPSRP